MFVNELTLRMNSSDPPVMLVVSHSTLNDIMKEDEKIELQSAASPKTKRRGAKRSGATRTTVVRR